ncbi:MAG: carboxypeptidase regulatory-like domain-containing protein [Silvibacterium sp.]
MFHKIDSTELKLRCSLRMAIETLGRMAKYFSLLATLFLLLPRQMPAQNRSTGEITGTVTDSSGAVIPSAVVRVQNEATHVAVSVKTTNSGNYDVPFLPSGRYQVTVAQQGFETFQANDVNIELDQTVRLDPHLTVGRVSQVVSVTSDQAQLATESSELELTFSDALVQNLPIVGRSVTELAVLAPGTSTAQSQNIGSSVYNMDPGRVNVQGSRAFTINATLNGGTIVLPNSDNFQPMVPSLGAVSEFGVIQNNFSAQYGNGTSVLNIVTKSGTNRFHGTAFEFLENTAMNATPGFSSSKPVLHYNQFGGAIGGPILRNKLFFFFSYQNTLSPSSVNGIFTVPTTQMVGGDFSAFSTPIIDPSTGQPFPNNRIPVTSFDAVAAKVLTYWPAPNYGPPGATSNNYFRLSPQDPKTPIYDYKVDWSISPAHQLSFTAHNVFGTTAYTGDIPGPACYNTEDCGSSGQYEYAYQGSEKWIINPRMVNAFYATILRENYWNFSPTFNQNFPSKLGLPAGISPWVFPLFQMTGGVNTSVGPGSNGSGIQNVFTYSDVLNWVKGNHNLSAGGQFSKAQVNDPQNWGIPTFTFNGQYTGNGFADFLLGDVQSYGYNATLAEFGERRTSGAVFVQDDWKIMPALTLNLGLRYQFEGGFYEAHNQSANFSPTTINPGTGTPGAIVFATSSNPLLQQNHPALFAPHIGFAQSLGQKTVVRGGFGLFFQQPSGEDQSNSGPPGYSISQTLIAQTVTTPPVFQLQNGPPPYVVPTPADRNGAILNGEGITWWQYNNRQPYSQEWHLSVQRQIGAETTAQVSYVGSVGRHLLANIDENQVPTSQLGSPIDQTNPQLLRPFPQYQGITTWANIASSSYNALEVAVQRRYSKGLTLIANYTYSKSMDNSSLDLSTWIGGDYQDAHDLPLSASSFDEPNRGVVAYVYDLPLGQGRAFFNQKGILDQIVGGWITSGSFEANSGYPFTIFAGGPNLTGSLAGSVFANRVGNLSAAKNATQWFNPANFADPAPYTYGDSGRNSTRTPGFWDFDAALQKNFNISETVKLQFRCDAFNLFNHRNLGEPGNSLDNSGTGQIVSSTAPRLLQVGSQISF